MRNPGNIARALVCACAAAGVLGCSSTKNQDERMLVAPPPKAADCVGQCTPDPGSAPVDCDAAEAGFEYLPIWDFESFAASTYGGFNMYVYDDDSASFRKPTSDINSAGVPVSVGWQPPSDDSALAQFCGKTTNHALHLWGGPYLGWGGGMGGRLARLGIASCDPLESTCAPLGQDFPNHTIDLRTYEGISFWARRGPDGQAGIRVALGDKHTDDDINVVQVTENEQAVAAGFPPPHKLFCERAKECGCRSKPCSPFYPVPTSDDGAGGAGSSTPEADQYYCWDPEVDPEIRDTKGTTTSMHVPAGDNPLADDTLLDYPKCGSYACDFPYEGLNGTVYELPDGSSVFGDGSEAPAGATTGGPPHPDTQFVGKSCTPFAERGSVVSSFCYDPATDPTPTPAEEKCGDHWMSAVHLTTDWKLYRVPFTDLLQQGWAKEFHTLDLASASVVRFTFDRGWIDYWIDDVSFYRRVK